MKSERHPDFFGGETKIAEKKLKSPYAAPPGTGPIGETCKTCEHSWCHTRFPRRWWKCGLIEHTHGPGTDIRVGSPACRFWEQRTNEGT